MTEAELYLDVVARLRDIVVAADVDTVVPTCPAWRVRDVMAHLTGLAEDWVTDNLSGYASEGWTANQVTRHASLPIEQLTDRLASAAEELVALPDHPVMGPPARFAFGDAVVHEADIRGALDGGRVPPDAVAASLKGQIAMWRLTLKQAEAPTVLLQTELREWWLGTPDDPAHINVSTEAYEVFRALAGRRSENQVRSWRWSDDPSPVIAHGLPYPFTFALVDVAD